MKKLINMSLLAALTFTVHVKAEEKPTVYVNKNIGFNVEGYKFKQPALPCDVDVTLVELLVKKGSAANLNMEVISTKEKIQNGKIPVLLIDIEQLSLRNSKSYGDTNNFNLPTIKINAAVLKGTDLQTAKHTCAMTNTDTFTMPTDKIMLNNVQIQICAEANKCLEDLGKDVIDWVKPQVK